MHGITGQTDVTERLVDKENDTGGGQTDTSTC